MREQHKNFIFLFLCKKILYNSIRKFGIQFIYLRGKESRQPQPVSSQNFTFLQLPAKSFLSFSAEQISLNPPTAIETLRTLLINCAIFLQYW
jgi:hypothetical protein